MSKSSRIVLVAVSLLGSHVVWGQVERASIVGTIRDNTGSVVPGVSVKVTNQGTNTSALLHTDGAGDYSATNLTPGVYTIEAETPGFSRRVYRDFTVQVAQVARLDITLEIGTVEQTVDVTAETPLLQTENAAVGQVISAQPISELPLNGRNFAQLALIAPGVTGLSYAQTGTIGAGTRPDEMRPGGTTIEANGARDSSNQLLLDGIDNSELIADTFIVRPTVDGLQEFKVMTNNAGAEFGRAGGAVIVTSTKSGTNRFHGSVFEFLRNSDLDAKNFFDRPNPVPIPPYKLNTFGGTIGGPILKNRTFFFVDYEGTRERLGQTVVVTVPTAAMKSGNFQGITTNGIFDPLTTTQVGSTYTRQRFPNDIVPASRFDPIAAKLVALYPLPQTSALANNYVANPVKQSTTDRGDVRIDHQISANQTLFGRYSGDSSRLFIPDTFNTQIGGNENSFAGPDDVLGQNMVVGYNRVMSPTVVAEYRLGFTKYKMFLLPTTLTDPVWSTIPGRETSDPFQPSAPIISPSGYAGLGNARSDPLIRREHMFENIGDVTWQHGSHNFKFGFDIRKREISETASPPGQSAFGRFNFDSSFTNNPASTAGTGQVIASMLLGDPASTVRDLFIPGTAHVFTNEYNMYARDVWRIGAKLTLNLGLHYEINTPFTESNNYWVNFDPVTATLLLAGKNASSTANIQTDHHAIGPRVGFAYQVSNKTVVRGGYGMFYDPQGNQGTNIRQERQFPYDLIYSLSPGSLFPGNTVSQGFFTLASIGPINVNSPFGSLKAVAPDYRNAAIYQFNWGVQRQLTSSTVVTLTYVGTLGRHLTWSLPLDQPSPGPGTIQTRRPYYAQFPSVTGISYLESAGNSEFESLQTVFEKRFSHGLYLNANWVWSHSMDNAPYDGGVDGPIPQDPTNRRKDWASSNNDARNRLNVYGTYELPFGPGKRFGNNTSAFNKYVVGGWQIDAIALMQSGQPFTVTTASAPTNTGTAGRADVVPGASQYPATRSVSQWFIPAAFTTPVAYNWGNAGRNILNGPPAANFDFTAEKKFLFTEARQVWFRAEFFNAPNHPQFGMPAAIIGGTGVGTISGTARPSRQIQFALKFLF
jgi:hypothetical protein